MTNLPVPILRTYTVGETEAAAYFNTLRDAVNFALNPPIAILTQSTVQSLPNAALTAITFDSTVTDSYGGHSNVTNNSRYTAQVAGWYDVWGVVGVVANGVGSRVAEIFKNGAGINYTQNWFVNDGTSSAVALTYTKVFLAVGDYVELNGYQASGGALNTITTGPQSALHIGWVHV